MMTPVCRTNRQWTMKFQACLRSYEVRFATVRDLRAESIEAVGADEPLRPSWVAPARSRSSSGTSCATSPSTLRVWVSDRPVESATESERSLWLVTPSKDSLNEKAYSEEFKAAAARRNTSRQSS